MLAHCLIDDIRLPVFENIDILIIVLLCLFIYLLIFYFLKFILSIFWKTTLETSVLLCALLCLSSVNIIFICIIMFYQINSLTHTHTTHTLLKINPGQQRSHVILQIWLNTSASHTLAEITALDALPKAYNQNKCWFCHPAGSDVYCCPWHGKLLGVVLTFRCHTNWFVNLQLLSCL